MGSFALQIAEFAKKAKGNADLVVRKVATDVLSSVVLKSPVDTGRFRGNWTTAIGSPDLSTSVDTDPSGSTAIARGAGVVADFSVGPSIYITNSLPYAQRLEHGWSKQAPAGMVGLTVIEYQDFVRNAVESLK